MTEIKEVTPELELSAAEFLDLAERDREAALKLMWPDDEERFAMKLLDAAVFDGFIESLKARLSTENAGEGR